MRFSRKIKYYSAVNFRLGQTMARKPEEGPHKNTNKLMVGETAVEYCEYLEN
jgi:hypothetical protein